MSAGAVAIASVNSMVPQPPQKVAHREVQTSVTLPLNGLRFYFPRASGGYFPVINVQYLRQAEIAAVTNLPKVLASLVQEHLTIPTTSQSSNKNRVWKRLDYLASLPSSFPAIDIMIVAPYSAAQLDQTAHSSSIAMVYNTTDQADKPMFMTHAEQTTALQNPTVNSQEFNCTANSLLQPALPFPSRPALIGNQTTRTLHNYLFVPKLTTEDTWDTPDEDNTDFQSTEMLRFQFIRSNNPILTTDEALEADIRANPETYEKLMTTSFEYFGIDIYNRLATAASVVAKKPGKSLQQAVERGTHNSVSEESGRLMSAISAAGAPIFRAPNIDAAPPKRVKKPPCTESLCTIL
jgi:hypothetical protein